MSTDWDVFTCGRCGKGFVNDRGGQPKHCVGCALAVAAEVTRASMSAPSAGGESAPGQLREIVATAISKMKRALGI